MASYPQATAEIESRTEIRAGDVLFNRDTTALLSLRALFHQETLAQTDAETFAMSPLSTIVAGDGLTLAQTSAGSVVASQTGFTATLRFKWIPYEIGDKIGDSPDWAARVEPISFAGISRDTMMIFPSMTTIKRMPDVLENGSDYIIDVSASAPMYPGNMILVKNVMGDQGQNEVVIERLPRDYWSPSTSKQEIANKTIIQRMWANVHIIYKLDKAYVGETCFPALICPFKDISTLLPMVPGDVSIDGALNMTRTGMHMRRLFWPVA